MLTGSYLASVTGPIKADPTNAKLVEIAKRKQIKETLVALPLQQSAWPQPILANTIVGDQLEVATRQNNDDLTGELILLLEGQTLLITDPAAAIC
jgi:hypothetical protein